MAKLVAVHVWCGPCQHCGKLPMEHGVTGTCLVRTGVPLQPASQYLGTEPRYGLVDADDRTAVLGGRIEAF